MPKLWNETIEGHRHAVREAILETAADLAHERGPHSLTMSEIADGAGIGRATLYKYFPDVESILVAWHERQISGHLIPLLELKDAGGDPVERLEAVLLAYAMAQHEHSGTELGVLLHRGRHLTRAEGQLIDLIRHLLDEAVAAGGLREDVPVLELAVYCLHAAAAARGLGSKAAVRRLVAVTLTGLRPAR